MRYLAGTILGAAGLFFAQAALAFDPTLKETAAGPAQKRTFYEKASIGGPAFGDRNVSPDGVKNFSPHRAGVNSDPNAGCIGGDPNCVLEVTDPTPQPTPKSEAAYAIAPGRTLDDLLKSGAQVDQKNLSLNLKNPLLLTTWNMVEPGIASGMVNALNLAHQEYNDRLLAELAYTQQLAVSQQKAEHILNEYQGCIINATSRSGKSFVEAQQLCMGDVGPTDSGASGATGASGSSGSSEWASWQGSETTAARAKDDFDHPENPVTAPTARPGAIDEFTILLSDKIFSQAGYKNDDPTDPGAGDEFVELVGDIQYISRPDPSYPSNRVYNKVVILPRVSPASVFKQLYYERLRQLKFVMRGLCDWKNSRRNALSADSFNPIEHQPGLSTTAGIDYWVDHAATASGDIVAPDKSFWAYLSLPGMQFDRLLGEALFDLFVQTEHGKFSVSADGAAALPCDRIEAVGTDPVWNDRNKQVDRYVRAYQFYAAAVAEGDRLLVLRKLHHIVNNELSQISEEERQDANEMILTVAGEQLPAESVEEIVETLRSFFAETSERMSIETGQATRFLKSVARTMSKTASAASGGRASPE